VAALVTGAHLRSVLAGVRGLGRAGIPVVALAPSRRAAGLLSRYVRTAAVGPDALAQPSAFAARVAELCVRNCPVVVYPGQEAAIDALLHARVRHESVRLAHPDGEGLEAVRDKRRLPALAEGAGLRTPATLSIGTARELRAAPPVTPCVLKPVASGGRLRSTTLLSSAAEVASVLAGLPADEPLLVQERVRGRLRAVALVVDREGRVVARFEQIARRTYPADAGISSEAVSVAPDEDLMARSADMLRRVGFWGLAQLQFVETAAGPQLIDVNPRFYGSLPLALAAGVNLPAAWHAVATGQGGVEPREYRVGVTYRWLESDVVAAAKGDVRRLLRRAPRPRVGAVWAADDPLPAVVFGVHATARRLGKLTRRIRRRR
jgi:predicted ATP-grasp superfamily ATP-dependent carboligase